MKTWERLHYCDFCGQRDSRQRDNGQRDYLWWQVFPSPDGKGQEMCPACVLKPEHRELVLSGTDGEWLLSALQTHRS